MTVEIHGPASLDAELEKFVERCLEGLSHQVRGDPEPFQEVWSHADNVAILGAVGTHAQGWEDVSAHAPDHSGLRRENGQWRLILRHANPIGPEDGARERALLADERNRVRRGPR